MIFAAHLCVKCTFCDYKLQGLIRLLSYASSAKQKGFLAKAAGDIVIDEVLW